MKKKVKKLLSLAVSIAITLSLTACGGGDEPTKGTAAENNSPSTGTVSTIDKARSKGVLHKNTAARKVSRMMRKANAAK